MRSSLQLPVAFPTCHGACTVGNNIHLCDAGMLNTTVWHAAGLLALCLNSTVAVSPYRHQDILARMSGVSARMSHDDAARKLLPWNLSFAALHSLYTYPGAAVCSR